jgi:molybdate transport system substrate-binding protein
MRYGEGPFAESGPWQRRRHVLDAGFIFSLLMASWGCTPVAGAGDNPRPGEEGRLIVFAASSLTSAFDELSSSFEANHPGVHVLANYASSSTLATQLIEGAQADIFAPANQIQMDKVRAAGRVNGEARIFAANHLVIVTPADVADPVRSLADLARPGLRLVLALPGVPARDYAEAMLKRAAQSPGYGVDFPQHVLANLISEEQNVRQVTAKVALGEADAAIVYASDLVGQSPATLRAVEIPAGLNVTALYPIAATADSTQPALAQEFVDFVLSPDGRAILARWGLLAPPEG